MSEEANLPMQEARVIVTLKRPGNPGAMRDLADVIAATVSSVLVPMFKYLPTTTFLIEVEKVKENEAEATYPPHFERRDP